MVLSSQVVYALLDEDGDQNLSTKEFNPVKKIQKMIDLKIVSNEGIPNPKM